MVKVVKKAKSRTFETKVNEALEIWVAQTEARYRIARAVYDAQDADTQDVIERMRDRIVAYSTGMIKIAPEGFQGVYKTIQVEMKYVDFNALYMAVGIMSDLALAQIRVGKFEFPPGICSECGSLLRPKRKRGTGAKAQ